MRIKNLSNLTDTEIKKGIKARDSLYWVLAIGGLFAWVLAYMATRSKVLIFCMFLGLLLFLMASTFLNWNRQSYAVLDNRRLFRELKKNDRE